MNSVEGKVAFITGGASGIGFGMARAFLEAGMRVVVTYRRRDHLESALSQLSSDEINRSYALFMDVTDRQQVMRAADEAWSVFGKVHVLCNNAGVNVFASAEQATFDDWDWVLGVNLGGVINGLVTFLPRIKAHGEGGHIINTASMAAFISVPHAGVYTTSKFAIRGLTESLHYTLATQNIGVSLLCPGIVRTNIHEAVLLRPQHLANTAAPPAEEVVSTLERIHSVGMDPLEVGRAALAGMLKDELYIFSHPEFRDELDEIHVNVIAALPQGHAPAARLSMEMARRRMKARRTGEVAE